MLRPKGQHLVELALCLAVVTAVFLSMQLYVQRSLQAKYKSGADYLFHDINQPAAQYEPYYVTSNTTVAHGAGVDAPVGWNRPEGDDIDEKFSDGREHIDKLSNRSGWQKTGPAQEAN